MIDAVIVLSKDGRVVAWNKVAEETFGWSMEEAVGQFLSELIVPENHRDAHLQGMTRLQSGGEPRVLNRRIELPAHCKDGREIPIELSITTTQATGTELYVGFLRDISERRSAEELLKQKLRENEVMLSVTNMASEAVSFEEAMRIVLRTICEIAGWRAGHAFLIDKQDERLLRSSSIWHEETPGCAARMIEASDGLIFRIGEGLPGEVLQADAPVWMSDINLEGNFIRKNLEFRGAFGFPLRVRGRTIAVLEFFSTSPSSPDQSQLLLAEAIGSQLGQVIERTEMNESRELLLRELNHRIKNLLTIIQSIARITFAGVDTAAEKVDAFNSRLSAMTKAQDILIARNWTDSTMRDVVEAGISSFESYRDRISIAGPDFPVKAADIQMSVLTIHELCTNALKYGALAHEGGEIAVSWGFEGDGKSRMFYFDWRETGCNLGEIQEKRGFGTSLLKRGLSGNTGSDVKIEYSSDGIHYRMAMSTPE